MSLARELLPRALHQVACGNETHELVWSRGEITTLDHADPDGERALVALGGPRSRCVDVLDAWHRQRTSLRVLTLAPRGPADVLVGDVLADPQPHTHTHHLALPGRVTSAYKSSVAFGWVSTSGGTARPPQTSGQRDDVDLMTLLGLGGGLPHRLVTDVLEHWAARVDELPDDSPELPALRAALYGRATAAVRSWLHDSAVELAVTLVPADATPAYRRTPDGIALDLPWRWLTDVWATGLTTTAARFALDATLDGRTVTLQTVGPDGGEPTPIRIELPQET